MFVFLLIWNYELNEHLTLFPILVTGTNGFIYIRLNYYIKLLLKQIFLWESLRVLVLGDRARIYSLWELLLKC